MMQQAPKYSPTTAQQRPQPMPRRRAYVNLEDTRNDTFGEWLYNHRRGLLATLLLYAVGVVVLLTTRVIVEIPPVEYEIEIIPEEMLEEEEVERVKVHADIEYLEQQVRNIKSNQMASFDAASGSEAMELDAETQELMAKIADINTSEGLFEGGSSGRGLGEGGGGSGSSKGAGDGKGEKGKFSGAVTVSYSFSKPVRNHRSLYTPAYRAKGGGTVVVDVWINRNGTVTDARIASSTNTELNAQALSAAKNIKTLFDINNSAPTSHRGTITYIFVAQ